MVNGFALKCNFSAADREAYHKSTYCQIVTNNSSIIRQFMMQVEYCRVLVLLTSKTEHLSANEPMQGTSTQTRSIPFHIFIAGLLHKSF